MYNAPLPQVNTERMKKIRVECNVAREKTYEMRAAGLDVFWEEPVDPRHPLFELPQVIATPHIAGVTDVNLARMFQRPIRIKPAK